MRLAIGIEYDGTAYNGWQRQRVGDGVQARVEAALGQVAGHDVEVACAGRTDAGVHASAQVGHFDSDAQRSARSWLLGANSNLPDDVCITWVKSVGDDFHARYTAVARRYRYCILNRLVRSALGRNRAWWVHAPLDCDAMHAAAQALIGEHDFSAFRAAGCQSRTAVREITDIAVGRCGDLVVIDVRANAFLMHMVRNITGSLVAVGRGEHPPGWLAELLAGRDRSVAGAAAPARGLTLVGVDYPPSAGLPEPPKPLHFMP